MVYYHQNQKNQSQKSDLMKSKKILFYAVLMLTVLSMSLTGCKKDKENEPSADPASLQQLSKDEEAVEMATDESMNDVNAILSRGNLKATDVLPCNATIDSTAVVNDTITIYITYNGLNCSGTRYRTGKVEIRRPFGVPWWTQDVKVRVRHINFTITRVASQKSITLNSVKTLHNVSGGVIWQLGNPYMAIVHRLWGHTQVTFDDNTTKTWHVARQSTYTGNPPQNLIITNTGFGSAGPHQDLLVWGVNRQGEEFFTQILQPVVIRQVCNWDPVAGVKRHAIPSDNKSATLTFGFNSNNQLALPGECPTKYRLDWQRNSQSGTVYLWL